MTYPYLIPVADLKRRSIYEDMVALALLLPLDPTLRLPDSLGTPESLCLQHCTRIIKTSEPHWEVRPADRRSLSDIYPLCYAASIVLAFSPSSQQARNVFERATSLLSRHMDDFTLVPYLLQALNSVAARLELPLPNVTVELLLRARLSTAELSDIPVALMLPVSLGIPKYISGQRALGFQRIGIEIGQLISGDPDLNVSSQSGYQWGSRERGR